MRTQETDQENRQERLTNLNREVAELVMREPMPPPPGEDAVPANDYIIGRSPTLSPKRGWYVVEIYEHGDVPEWLPRAFTNDVAAAQEAVDALVARYAQDVSSARADSIVMRMEYRPSSGEGSGLWNASIRGILGVGETPAEAMCDMAVSVAKMWSSA